MCDSTATMAPSLPAKRKRAQISYAEPEDDMFDSGYETDSDPLMNEIGEVLPVGDTAYGSRKVSASIRKNILAY